MSALLTFGTEAPRAAGSSGAGPIMFLVLRRNQSKVAVRRPSRAVRSRPKSRVSMVSQVIRALTIPGMEAVLGLLPSRIQLPLLVPTGMVW